MQARLELARRSREEWSRQQREQQDLDREAVLVQQDAEDRKQQRQLQAEAAAHQRDMQTRQQLHRQELELIELLDRVSPAVLMARAKEPEIARALGAALFKDWPIERIVAVQSPAALAQLAREQNSRLLPKIETKRRQRQTPPGGETTSALEDLLAQALETLRQQGSCPPAPATAPSTPRLTAASEPTGKVSQCCGAHLAAGEATCPVCGAAAPERSTPDAAR